MLNFPTSVFSAIAFLDSALPDLQTLRNSIAAGTEVITLDGTRDGLEQITAGASESQQYQKHSYHFPRPSGEFAARRDQSKIDKFKNLC